MTDTAESLDPLRLPLIGERLIEASAGTGTTFTIDASNPRQLGSDIVLTHGTALITSAVL